MITTITIARHLDLAHVMMATAPVENGDHDHKTITPIIAKIVLREEETQEDIQEMIAIDMAVAATIATMTAMTIAEEILEIQEIREESQLVVVGGRKKLGLQ